MQRFCDQCGAPLKDGAKFCPNCGNSTQEQAQPQYQQPRPTYQQPPQANYGGQVSNNQQSPQKNGGGPVTVIIALLLLVGGPLGYYYFKFKPEKERAQRNREEAMSAFIQSQKKVRQQKTKEFENTENTETPAEKPQQSMGTGKVKVKEVEFFGVTLPIPDIGTVTENKTVDKGVGNELITIRYDGISYEDYIEYCKQLESIHGWKSMRGTSDFPEDYNNTVTMVTFTGFYKSPLYVNVYYLSDYYRDGTDWPAFALELMNF